MENSYTNYWGRVTKPRLVSIHHYHDKEASETPTAQRNPEHRHGANRLLGGVPKLAELFQKVYLSVRFGPHADKGVKSPETPK